MGIGRPSVVAVGQARKQQVRSDKGQGRLWRWATGRPWRHSNHPAPQEGGATLTLEMGFCWPWLETLSGGERDKSWGRRGWFIHHTGWRHCSLHGSLFQGTGEENLTGWGTLDQLYTLHRGLRNLLCLIFGLGEDICLCPWWHPVGGALSVWCWRSTAAQTCSRSMLDSSRATLCHRFCLLLLLTEFLGVARDRRGSGLRTISSLLSAVIFFLCSTCSRMWESWNENQHLQVPGKTPDMLERHSAGL